MAPPLLTPAEWTARWQALKDWLAESTAQLESLPAAEASHVTVIARSSHISANRSTLAKMRELEG